MKLKWEKYFYELWSATMQNVGVVGSLWLTMNGLNGIGIDVPQMNLKSLGWSILLAGALPALFKFWEKQPLPEIDETITTTTTRTTKEVSTSGEHHNPEKPKE